MVSSFRALLYSAFLVPLVLGCNNVDTLNGESDKDLGHANRLAFSGEEELSAQKESFEHRNGPLHDSIKKCMESKKEFSSVDFVDEFIGSVDSDENQLLSREEVAKLLEMIDKKRSQRQADCDWRKKNLHHGKKRFAPSKMLLKKLQAVKMAYRCLDKDGDQFLSDEEVENKMEKLKECQLALDNWDNDPVSVDSVDVL